jgi:1-phosphatidylinositol-4-phosphate 5-kinase
VFDLKGSDYDREVLSKDPDAEREKRTLKDSDFYQLEKQVWIEGVKRKGSGS